MLNQEEVLKLLQEPESELAERTVSISNLDKVCEAICAFSNDLPNHSRPGYFFIGVDNQGKLSGLQVSDEHLLNLAAIRSDGNIQPMPTTSVNKYSFPEGEVAVIEVQPSDLPPVRYKGRVHIRVGSRRAIATESEERFLSERRTSRARTFDATPCIESGLNDLVLDLFLVTYRPRAIAAEVIKENDRSIEEQMASLRFYDLKRNCATHAGIILFSKAPLNWLPGAYLQFVRFNGEQLSDEVIQERTFSGDLLTVLRELDAFLPTQLQSRPRPSSALRETLEQDFPLVALREFLMNAVMHRSYESNTPIRFYWFNGRIEIQNPGGLYGEATPENFPRMNSYRNPVIAEAMKALGYVNKYGRGVLHAQEALRKNGNPKAEFQFEQHYFLATLRRRP